MLLFDSGLNTDHIYIHFLLEVLRKEMNSEIRNTFAKKSDEVVLISELMDSEIRITSTFRFLQNYRSRRSTF